MNINQPETDLYEAQLCPFLGLSDDPQTALAFPSAWNNCHKVRPPQSVSSSHQRKHCLVVAHRQCPVLQTESLRPLPSEAQSPRALRMTRMKMFRRWLAIGVMLLFAIAVVWYVFIQPTQAPAVQEPQASAIVSPCPA